MSRKFYINGESMVRVKLPQSSSLNGWNDLGLAEDRIEVGLMIHSEALYVDSYGKRNPIDEQVFGGEAVITMRLIHFDPVVLQECVRLTFPAWGTAGSPTEGQLGRAGTTRGQGAAIGSSSNSYITLNISSPVAVLPYNFPTVYLRDDPYTFPVGAEKTVAILKWKALAYSTDPWGVSNGSSGGPGQGSLGAVLYDRTIITSPNN